MLHGTIYIETTTYSKKVNELWYFKCSSEDSLTRLIDMMFLYKNKCVFLSSASFYNDTE